VQPASSAGANGTPEGGGPGGPVMPGENRRGRAGGGASDSAMELRRSCHQGINSAALCGGHQAAQAQTPGSQPQRRQQQQQQQQCYDHEADQQQRSAGRRHHRRRGGGTAAAAAFAFPQRLALAVTVLLAALLLPEGVLPPAAATEINSAVSIFGPWDYELREDGTSRCTDMVQRTAELGLSMRTMFLPTLFWVSKHEDGYFDRNQVSSLFRSGIFKFRKIGWQSKVTNHDHNPIVQVDAEEYFDDQREVEYFCFNQQYHRAPKQQGVRHIVTGFFLGAGASQAAEQDQRPMNWQATQHSNRLRVSILETLMETLLCGPVSGVKRSVAAQLQAPLSCLNAGACR